MLDVGAANGDLTKHYQDRFQDAVLIEPAEKLRSALSARFPDRSISGATIEQYSTDAETRGRKFDFIVASHVLIYVDEPLKALDRLIDMLEPGGRLAVVMLDRDCDWYRYIARFSAAAGGKAPNDQEVLWTDITAHLETRGTAHRVIDVDSKLRPPSVADLIGISDFVFNTGRPVGPALQNEISEYVLGAHMKNGNVELRQRSKMIVIERPSATEA
jgi:trans-aconitate methyltransferase